MDETTAIMTDDFAAYDGIGDHNARYQTINHCGKEYVSSDVHANAM